MTTIAEQQVKDLLKKLIDASTYTVDVQAEAEYTQVAVWVTSFGKQWSICFQNVDMAGNQKGQAVYTNDGANCGLDEARDILKDMDGFKDLVDLDTHWSYKELDELIHKYCDYISEKEKIADHFLALSDTDSESEAEEPKTIQVTLVEDAYLGDYGYYTAMATISANPIYNADTEDSGYCGADACVRWEILDGFDGDDGANACDWSNPEGVMLNGRWIADKKAGVNEFNGYVFEYLNTDKSPL